jgi:hypothetical protein
MAYLDNSEIIVDAILTKKGREKLSTGEGLNITKFALGDDEIDYTLYEPAHPKGSAFYDSAIKAIPITEASPDETQTLRFKLVTLPKGTTKIPVVEFGIPNITVTQNSGQVTLSPTTSPSGNTQSGYTVVLANKNAGSLVGSGAAAGSGGITVGDEITSTAAIERGLTFTFLPNPNISQTIRTTITVFGNETGGSQTIPVTVTYVQPT